jgi:3-deoxy-D-manno-octulosonic-acid transferase
MYVLYSFLILLFFVIVSPYFVYQAIRYKKYIASLRQRLGYLPVSFNLDGDAAIWIHAVSVGEVLTARALIPELKARYPHLRLFVSTTTLTGQQVARRNVRDIDAVFYFPFDLPFIVRRTLRLVQPRLFVMMETEIWPNLLRACRREGVKTVLVNGRISSRSYTRYRLIRPLFRRVLADIDRFCVQSDESKRRLIELGANPARVTVTGSLKFDSLEIGGAAGLARSRDRVLRFFRGSERTPIVIAASTSRGEEAFVLGAFRKILDGAPSALLVIAPRHPERFAEVEQLVDASGFTVIRRSELRVDAEPRAEVVVLDTLGELARLYQIATVVFVGGSLVDAGGHNILEPAVFGKPIVFGPHMDNFAEIAQAFLVNGAAREVRSGDELAEALLALLGDPVQRASLGAAARALVEANRGAKDRTLDVIAGLIPPHGAAMPGGVVRPFRIVH